MSEVWCGDLPFTNPREFTFFSIVSFTYSSQAQARQRSRVRLVLYLSPSGEGSRKLDAHPSQACYLVAIGETATARESCLLWNGMEINLPDACKFAFELGSHETCERHKQWPIMQAMASSQAVGSLRMVHQPCFTWASSNHAWESGEAITCHGCTLYHSNHMVFFMLKGTCRESRARLDPDDHFPFSCMLCHICTFCVWVRWTNICILDHNVFQLRWKLKTFQGTVMRHALSLQPMQPLLT